MFGRIARRYDLMNRLLSLGIDGGWRRFAARRDAARGPATGPWTSPAAPATSPSSWRSASATTGIVVGLDITREMLVLGHEKSVARQERRVDHHEGDAMRLPYADGVFRAATMAFGGRNVPDLTGAFREMARVLAPGGRVVFLELNRPRLWGFRHLFDFYFHTFSPLVGGLISGDRVSLRVPAALGGPLRGRGGHRRCMRDAGPRRDQGAPPHVRRRHVHVGVKAGAGRAGAAMATPETTQALAAAQPGGRAARLCCARCAGRHRRARPGRDGPRAARALRQRRTCEPLPTQDRPLPIGHGQTISQPRMVALMLQELALKGDERVLEVGTGSGYQTALLAELARRGRRRRADPGAGRRARSGC